MEQAQAIASWQGDHLQFGHLAVEIFIRRGQLVACFALETISGLKLHSFRGQEGYCNTLECQWYNHHLFERGEKLFWQSEAPVNFWGNLGPWNLYKDGNSREVCWEIPKIEVQIPFLRTKHKLEREDNSFRLCLYLENIGQEEARARLDVGFCKTQVTGAFSGPSQMQLRIAARTQQCLEYLLHCPGDFRVRVYHRDILLLMEHISIPQGQSGGESETVAVRITTHGKEIQPKKGYYRISPNQEITLTINPGSKAASLKNVRIKHPHVSIVSVGKSDDDEFSYKMKFHPNSPLTSELFVLYSLEYRNSEVRSHTLSFKLKAQKTGLLLIGLLFITPNLTEILGLNERVAIYALMLVLFALAPLAYDWYGSL